MLGKLVHYGVDAVLLSTVLAGIRRSSGFTCVVFIGLLVSILTVSFHRHLLDHLHYRSVNPTTVPEGTPRSLFEKYLSVGESVFDMAQATVVNSPYFKRT